MDTVPKKSESSSEPIRRLICNKWRIGDISCIALGELKGAASSSTAALNQYLTTFAFFLYGLLIYDCAPIAQGEISMSVAFPTHVWKIPNICTHIIVWLFSHMCAFSHTYVSKSKHVWKIAPRCKYTNVFGFFQTCWIKVKHLPKLTCVVFYTQVWLFSNIFAKSQTCVEKTIMFH